MTQILREINFGDSRSAKYAILTYLEALTFIFMNFCNSEGLKYTKLTKSDVLELLDSPKLISHKI